jgi:polysaccharide deacetylase family protein (PEP-CTERM system associated)
MIRALHSRQLDISAKPSATAEEGPLVNAFTVDVEDYFQVSAFERRILRDDWENWELRVERNTRRILDRLARHDVMATFFVLGWVADRRPDLVREIALAGHEVASHGYWHRLVYSQSATLFREDIRRARGLLQDLSGQPVNAFRAPSFSITRETPWAHEILVEEGFEVDSSVFPIHHDRYGIPGASRFIHRIETPSGSLWEFPPTVRRLGKMNLPVGGGGYFRLYPFWWTRACLSRINDVERRPFMFYMHPWEIDPGQPRVRGIGLASRFRHRVNLRKTEARLERLLASFRFSSVGAVLAKYADPPAQPSRSTTENLPRPFRVS